MADLRIFQTSNGDICTISAENVVKKAAEYFDSLGITPWQTGEKIDAFGARTITLDSAPAHWCKVFPLDHPQLPKGAAK